MCKVIVLPMLERDGHLVFRVWNRRRDVYYAFQMFAPAWPYRILHAYVSPV